MLTAKQEKFCQALALEDNQAEAYRSAYNVANMSPGSISQAASELARNPAVIARVEELRLLAFKKHQITADRILVELGKIGFANMGDYYKTDRFGTPYIDLSELTHEQKAAIAEIQIDEYTEGRGSDAREIKKVKIKLHDKRLALVDMGKHIGMFRERVEVSGPNGGPIHTQATVDVSKLSNSALTELLAAADAVKPR